MKLLLCVCRRFYSSFLHFHFRFLVDSFGKIYRINDAHHKAYQRDARKCVHTDVAEKNEWKNVFRIKVIKVNFYYMNIEYYIEDDSITNYYEQHNFIFDEAIFVRTIYLNIVLSIPWSLLCAAVPRNIRRRRSRRDRKLSTHKHTNTHIAQQQQQR